MKTDTFEMVEVGRIAASKTNPRKHFDDASLLELRDSIVQQGIVQPLVVRPAGNGKGYELVCGERRWRAAKLGQLLAVPCVVRELSDAQVLEIQLIENLQREDVSALEEAEGFKRLIDAGAYTAESLAAKLGKSRSHVFGRLRLVKASEPVKKAVSEGKIDASVAGLITSVSNSKAQNELLGEAMRGSSFRYLKDEVGRRYQRTLNGAAWKLDDKELVKGAGPCTTCPKRSGVMDPDCSSPNVCTDVACWTHKAAAWADRLVAEARTAGKPVLTKKEANDYNVRAKYVELDEHAHDIGEYNKTWRTLLKGKDYGDVTLAALRKYGGEVDVLELVPKQKIWELFPKAKQQGRGGDDGWRKRMAAERKKQQERHEQDQVENRAVVAKVVEAFEKKDVPEKVWRALWQAIWHACLNRGDEQLVFERRGKEKEMEIDTQGWTTEQLRGLAVEALMSGMDRYEQDVIEPLCSALKIDQKAVGAAAVKAWEAEKKKPKGKQKPEAPPKGAKKTKGAKKQKTGKKK
jgi:ParB/RepB/Spo0J family partition protein